MDSCGIGHAVIAPSEAHVAVLNNEGNRHISGFVKNDPERFSGLAVANPWYGNKALETLEIAFKSGLCGMFLNPARQGFHLPEHIVDPLLDLCVQYDKPVYSHTGTPVFCMPFQLAELARRFPAVYFVMGHASWSDFWYDLIPAAQQAENIIIDISCTTGQMIKNIINSIGADRIIFGSGFPQSLPENELKKIDRMNLSSNVFDKIMYSNAISLWRISA
jgi:predicted TIM-barrel fold metal-dependent hydrolase